MANWFTRQRQEWITERLATVGHIGRLDLMHKFEISSAQASMDLRAFIKANRRAMRYDARSKRYVSTAAPKCEVFSRPECIFRYCPNPDGCAKACETPFVTASQTPRGEGNEKGGAA